jgi:hypothetical protein
MKRTLKILVGLLVLAVGVGALTVGGSAQATEETVTLNSPNSQTVEVDAVWDGTGNITAELQKDGTVVESATAQGTNGSLTTLSLQGTGLAKDDYTLSVSSAENATVASTRLVTDKTPALNLSQNDTVAVDVEFDAIETTNATVTLSDGGTDINSSQLTFDPVEYSDGSGIKTWTYELGQDVDALNASIESVPAGGYEQAWVSEDSGGALLGGGGIIAGASRNQILGFLAVLVGLLVAYERDLI